MARLKPCPASGKSKPDFFSTLFSAHLPHKGIAACGRPNCHCGCLYQAVLRHGLTVHKTMELPVGHIYLRVGVHDLQKDKVGAIELPGLIAARSGASQLH